MNPKIDKITVEIEKTKERIAASQARLEELEKQKTDLENTEIVNLFRSVDVPPRDLAGYIQAFRERGVPPVTASMTRREVDSHEE